MATSEPKSQSSDSAVAPATFLNYYLCPADYTDWTDCWSCTSNDKCPACGREIEPYRSVDL